jgi:hypothetical protein
MVTSLKFGQGAACLAFRSHSADEKNPSEMDLLGKPET